jgi:nicotinate-nucleotide adenylyltransferase
MAGLRVGFFGGSFDPPHWGHLAVARAAAEQFALDRVLLAPTGLQPLKPQGATASYADRLEMVRLLCGELPYLEASELDAPLGGTLGEGVPNYTIDTLTRLREELGEGDRIYSIVGVDAFLALRRWRDPGKLLAIAEWIVVTRPGFSLGELVGLGLSEAERAKVHLLGGVAEEVSSTGVREALRDGRNCAGMVPGSILEYIRLRHLYRAAG